MQGLAVVTFCVAMSVVVFARPEEKYTDMYDNVDVDEILNNERLYVAYFHCLKTGQKCTPDGKKLKEILPDALQTGCSKCTEEQNIQSKKVIHFMAKNKPDNFKELENLYDRNHLYRTKYADRLRKEGIILPN